MKATCANRGSHSTAYFVCAGGKRRLVHSFNNVQTNIQSYSVLIAVPVPHALPMLEDTFHPIPSGVMPRHRHGCSGKAGRGGVTGFKGRTAGFHNLGVTLDLVSPIWTINKTAISTYCILAGCFTTSHCPECHRLFNIEMYQIC